MSITRAVAKLLVPTLGIPTHRLDGTSPSNLAIRRCKVARYTKVNTPKSLSRDEKQSLGYKRC